LFVAVLFFIDIVVWACSVLCSVLWSVLCSALCSVLWSAVRLCGGRFCL
jgi:hypothetical protein